MLKKASKVALITLLVASFGLVAAPAVRAEKVAIANARSSRPDSKSRVADWFAKYDCIRHEAQMSDSERERSRRLMTAGLAASVFQSADSAQDKAAAVELLKRMVARYQRAYTEISALPSINETRKLQLGYKQYFQDAGGVFADYLKVQNNLFATDASGNGILSQLSARKDQLEQLDAANKELDARLRDKYHVAPYAWEVAH